MSLVLLVVCGLIGAVTAPAASAGGPTNLPTVLARQIAAVNRIHGAPPVLLPSSMPLDARRVFATGGGTPHGYDLELGSVRHCGGATVCFIAAFTAQHNGKVFGHRVSVRGASRAGFVPLSCGASCAPPQIDFLVRGVLYTIQANLTGSRHDRATLAAAAAAAIAAGPRVRAPGP